MFKPTSAFSGLSVDNLERAQAFYEQTLGLTTESNPSGMRVYLPGDHFVWLYTKPDHQAPNYTVLNFVVDDITAAVDKLVKRGVSFERYDGPPQDERGIMHGIAHNMGPDIAWFKDPAGNILAVLQEA